MLGCESPLFYSVTAPKHRRGDAGARISQREAGKCFLSGRRESSGLHKERTGLGAEVAEIDSENESSIREIVKNFGWVLLAQLKLQTLQPQGMVSA